MSDEVLFGMGALGGGCSLGLMRIAEGARCKGALCNRCSLLGCAVAVGSRCWGAFGGWGCTLCMWWLLDWNY